MDLEVVMSPDRFRVLFDHASDAHMIVVDDGITDCNDAMISILGAKDRSQVLSLHPAALSPAVQPDGRRSDEKSRDMDGQARARGWHRFEWMHQKLDGTPLPVEVTLNAVTIDGRPGLVAVWHDLTERKRMEAELRRSAAALADANALLTAANDRMRAELEAAALVQRSLLPTTLPEVAGVQFAWRFRPCSELAGDLLDVFRLGESKIGFYVLDVTGHGVAASLLSVSVSHALSPHSEKSAFRRSADTYSEPFEVVRRLNEDYAARGGPLQLFTICCGTLDLVSREVHYVSAGHPGPLRVALGGDVEVLNVPGLPVGVMRGVPYVGASVQLRPGDRFFVYSDGLPEAVNSNGDLLGEERLGEIARGARDLPLDACADRILAEAVRWSSPKDPHDDISLVAVEIGQGAR
jgi:sigma-B regulation protein RsbU (phosphoserine phosphatase)